MPVKRITYLLILTISLLISADLSAQVGGSPKWEAGINAGAYMYQGDLTIHPTGSKETIRPGFGVSVTRLINSKFAARLMVNMANLAGDESIYAYPKFRRHRNLAFNASVKELVLSFQWNVLGSGYDDAKYQPYVFAGAGASFVNVNRDYSRFDTSYYGPESAVQKGLAADIVTPTPRVLAVVPVGAGIRYHISEKLVLNVEGAYRLMNNDYLDGFSKSANTDMKDHYSSLTVGIAYKFGGKEKYGCPTVN